MPTEADRKDLAATLVRLLTDFAGLPPEKVSRMDDLGRELNFEDAVPGALMLSSLAERLLRLPVAELPYRAIEQGMIAFNTALTAIKNIQQFKPSAHPTDMLERRNLLLRQFEDAQQKFYQQVAPFAAIALAWADADAPITAITDEGRRVIVDVQSQAAALEVKQRELDDVLRLAKEATQKVGAAQFASHFRDEADSAGNAGMKWLWATIGASAFTLTAVVLNIVYTVQHPAASTAQAISLAIAKLLGFSVLFGATIWCARIYRANRHNMIVNRHRQNALSSFEAFAAATSDPETKNAVLLQATQSIFAPQSSGFVESDAEAALNPQIIEVFRGLNSQSR